MESIVTEELLKSLPYDSYCCGLSKGYDVLRVSRKPTNVIDDLKTGEIGFMFYWYHDLMVLLVDLALKGDNISWYLHGLHKENPWHFVKNFYSSFRKLDRLIEKSVRTNIFDEVLIKDGKIK